VAERRKAAAEAKKADRIAHGKVCTKCDTKKPLLEFKGDSRKLDSKKASCKACENAAIRLRYSVNDEYRQKVRGRASEYRSSQRYLDPIRKEQRRLAKDHERRLRGAPEVPRRSPIVRAKLCDSHVNEWSRLAAQRYEMALVEFRSLPYAHVDDYRKEVDRRHWHEFDKHRPETRTNRIARRKYHRENLTDEYIVRLLTNGDANVLKKADVPQSLIEVKRTHLQLQRLLSDMKKGHDHEEC